jgi:hypothetical protein
MQSRRYIVKPVKLFGKPYFAVLDTQTNKKVGKATSGPGTAYLRTVVYNSAVKV